MTNWNTIYHSYENIALFLISIFLGSTAFTSPSTADKDMCSFQHTLNYALQKSQNISIKNMHLLRKDVRKQGNSREGLERIKRTKVLIAKVDSLHQILEKFKQKFTTNTSVQKLMMEQRKAVQIEHLLAIHVDWLNREFKDLDLPQFERITKNHLHKKSVYTTQYTNATIASAKVLLTIHQYTLERYKIKVMKKLGAGDVSVTIRCGPFYRSPVVVAPSKVIQVGDEFKADLLLNTSIRFVEANCLTSDQDVNNRRVNINTKSPGKKYWTAIYQYWDEDDQLQEIKKQVPYQVVSDSTIDQYFQLLYR